MPLITSKRTSALGRLHLVSQVIRKPVSISAADVLAAGGAAKYARTEGVNPKTAKISGLVRVSRAETDKLQAELRDQQ